MKSAVVIKGNKHGFVIALDSDVEFESLCRALKDKFRDSGAFFDLGRPVAISFTGRDLSGEEQDRLIGIIEENSPMIIRCIVDGAGDMEDRFVRALEKAGEGKPVGKPLSDKRPVSEALSGMTSGLSGRRPVRPEAGLPGAVSRQEPVRYSPDMETGKKGQFYRGILRSGQRIETKDSFVILGDVNPGAQIVAGGNVVVLGSLKGTVYAGYPGDKDAIVAALNMEPMQIQIGPCIARSADQAGGIRNRISRRKKQPEMEARMAFVDGVNICIEKIDRELINEIVGRKTVN